MPRLLEGEHRVEDAMEDMEGGQEEASDSGKGLRNLPVDVLQSEKDFAGSEVTAPGRDVAEDSSGHTPVGNMATDGELPLPSKEDSSLAVENEGESAMEDSPVDKDLQQLPSRPTMNASNSVEEDETCSDSDSRVPSSEQLPSLLRDIASNYEGS